jgi:integrase
VSKDYNHEIGYETLQKDFEVYKGQAPRGVTLAKGGNSIYLQFKTPNKPRSKYRCNCTFTLDGMIDAVRKASRVKEKLESLTSEVEFWQWYDKEIKQESQLVDDQRTFVQAVIEVKRDFWDRPSRTKRKRDKSSPSDQSSWYRTYGCFYQHLPEHKAVNLADIQKVINMQKRGTRNYKYAVSAMKKLARTIKRQDILDALDGINVIQTENAELQTVKLEDFLNWRDKTLDIAINLRESVNFNTRKSWLWAFSMQVVYGLRISEVFAIKNLTEPYVTSDGKPILALNDPNNTDNLLYIGEYTVLGTKVKTGKRLARPMIPPKYPDLIEILEIKNCLLPQNKPDGRNSETVRKFYSVTARKQLVKWNAPTTQTHAFRHLANINGIQAGIPQEVRAQSLGHTVQMNESVYKKRQSTQTTIDLLLNSNSNAIDFVSALAEAKKLVKGNESDKQVIARLLSIIYQKNETEIRELL